MKQTSAQQKVVITAVMGLFFTVPLLMKVRKGPNMVSSATA